MRSQRPRDQVRGVVDLPAKAANHVPVGLAEGVGDTLVVVRGEEVLERGRRPDPRRRELDRLERHRLLDLLAAEPQLLANPGGRRLEPGAIGLPIGEPPTPVLSPAGIGAGYQWMPRISEAKTTCSLDASSSGAATGGDEAVGSRGFSPFAALESGKSL